MKPPISSSNTAATETLSLDEANKLVEENQGWAESIARSVARSWNMDWKLDGLDGAAMEALIFCSRRFQPARGVPFRGYARKRIHEASTEAARRSKGWKKGVGANSKGEQQAREISAELFNIFPELREGELPMSDSGDEGDVRSSIRQLLVGASIIAVKQGLASSQPDEVMDYKRMVEFIAALEPIHQALLWKVYWEGNSMRTVATEWSTDELNVIREHKSLLTFLHKNFQKGKQSQKLKVRPGLKAVALKHKRELADPPFSRFIQRE